MITLQNVSKYYGKVKVLHNVSFTAPTHSITALLGLNGAGKTTLLKAIASMHYVDSGHISVNGIDTFSNVLENKSQIGFVADHSIFYPDYTVYEYLISNCSIMFPSLDKIVKNEKIQSVIELCNLQKVLGNKIKTLSKGYTQRLAFAVALLHNPPVLLLDEPTSGLDPQQIVEMRKLIFQLQKDKTIILSTHLMQEVEALCSSIAIIHEGILRAFGSKSDICLDTKCDSLEKAFLHIITEEQKVDVDEM